MTNDFARRVVHGFAFGLGFALAAALGVVGAGLRAGGASGRKGRRRAGLLHSRRGVRSVRVEAAYYDAAGRLVDLCGWYVATSLAPGEEKPFKVACGGTPERPAPESASVRLRIVEGF
ncbi:MAG: hypothetical protein IPI87_16160 [Betaproteobacteria bacterium]|nr:hypothetical protein [Betaproteobacteria bacterium]